MGSINEMIVTLPEIPRAVTLTIFWDRMALALGPMNSNSEHSRICGGDMDHALSAALRWLLLMLNTRLLFIKAPLIA